MRSPRTCTDLVGQLHRLPPAVAHDPAASLTELKRVLERALHGLPGQGVRVGMLDRTPDDAAFAEARHQPVRSAAARIGHFASGLPMRPAALQRALREAVEPARFQQQLALLARPDLTDTQLEQVLSRTVTAIASRLLGLLPATPMPWLEVHLYDAPNETLPKVPGLNTHAHQARKIVLEPELWQMHVPRHRLQQPPRQLAAGLARAAAC